MTTIQYYLALTQVVWFVVYGVARLLKLTWATPLNWGVWWIPFWIYIILDVAWKYGPFRQ